MCCGVTCSWGLVVTYMWFYCYTSSFPLRSKIRHGPDFKFCYKLSNTKQISKPADFLPKLVFYQNCRIVFSVCILNCECTLLEYRYLRHAILKTTQYFKCSVAYYRQCTKSLARSKCFIDLKRGMQIFLR